MKLFKFRYNSYHKFVVGILVLAWAVYQFSNRTNKNTYDNGQIKSIGKNIKGNHEGQWVWYYDNGKKEMEGQFVDGRREGKWKFWSRNGKLLSEGNYKDDKLNGEYIQYDTLTGTAKIMRYQEDMLLK